jgi:hypothetical protein
MNDRYTREIRDNTNYLATWLPNVHVAPGQVGRITNNEFTYVGTLTGDFKIPVDTEDAPSQGDFEYYSAGAVKVTAKLAGEVPPQGSILAKIDAGINLAFSREHAVAFRAAKCRATRIRNQIDVGKAVLALHEKNEWPDDLVVVTEVITAGSTTILISSSSNASIDLRASGSVDIKTVHIADVDAGLSVSNSSNMGIQTVAEGGLTPLMRTQGIQKRLLRSATFRGRRGAAESPATTSFGGVDYSDFSGG